MERSVFRCLHNILNFSQKNRDKWFTKLPWKSSKNTGLLVHADCAREIFGYHGCDVNADGLVKIPHKVIEKYIKMFPSSYTFTAQDPSLDITILEQGPCVVTASSAPFIIDPKTREQRGLLPKILQISRV